MAGVVDAWVRRAADDGAPASVSAWTARYGDTALRDQWNALQDALYGQGGSTWSASLLVDGLSSARQRWKRSRRQWRQRAALPPLNPTQ
jgi:hypothetical protein